MTATEPATCLAQRLERLLLLTFLILSVGFSLSPILEGPDEVLHLRFTLHLIDERSLPDPRTEPQGQFHQAPLFYLMSIPLTLAAGDFETPARDTLLNENYGVLAEIPGNDNKNLHLHPAWHLWPRLDQPLARAIRFGRWFSALLGALTLIVCTELFRLLWPDRPALRIGALAFMALHPMFIFQNSIYSNDPLLYLCSALTLLLALHQSLEAPSTERTLWFGLVMGAALLAKATSVFLAIPVALLTLAQWRRQWKSAALAFLIVVLSSAWWYIRNYLLYGDFSAGRPVLEPWGVYLAEGRFDLAAALARSPAAYATFWARFGHGAVAMPDGVYRFYDSLAILIGLGLLIGLLRLLTRRASARPDPIRLLAIASFGLTWLALLIYFSGLVIFANHGRYLLPGLPALAAAAAASFAVWIPEGWQMRATMAGAALMAAVAAFCLWGGFLPSYRPRPLPANAARSLDYDIGGMARITGVEAGTVYAQPGELTHFTVYWEGLAPARDSQDIRSYLHSTEDRTVRRDSYPATGNLLAQDITPGMAWAERFNFRVPADAERQRVYPLIAGFYDAAIDQPLPVNGSDQVPFVGRLVIPGPLTEAQPLYRFGESIGLLEPALSLDGDQVTLCLPWLGLAPMAADYQFFVHLVDEEGAMLAQIDAQPLDWRYPTSVWFPGETVEDCVVLAPAQPGASLRVGWYDINTLQRLPLSGPGESQDNALILHP